MQKTARADENPQATAAQNNRQDLYTRITAGIVEQLEKGVRPWVKPWNAEHAAGRITRPLRHNGQPYAGINVISLWASALVQNFAAPIWMTYRQALELKANVRKGEKGSLVVYANSITRTEHDEQTGEDIEREIPYLKAYSVFNVEQIDGLPSIYYAKAAPALNPAKRSARAEKFFAATGADIRHGGLSAFYNFTDDYIQMPPFETFRDAESYYGTLGHETLHWSGSKSRLDRDFSGHRFGTNAYAFEELVAEIGSAYIAADLEIALEPREENASYLSHWLEILKSNSKAIFTAAAHAQRAADFLRKFSAADSAVDADTPAAV